MINVLMKYMHVNEEIGDIYVKHKRNRPVNDHTDNVNVVDLSSEYKQYSGLIYVVFCEVIIIEVRRINPSLHKPDWCNLS